MQRVVYLESKSGYRLQLAVLYMHALIHVLDFELCTIASLSGHLADVANYRQHVWSHSFDILLYMIQSCGV